MGGRGCKFGNVGNGLFVIETRFVFTKWSAVCKFENVGVGGGGHFITELPVGGWGPYKALRGACEALEDLVRFSGAIFEARGAQEAMESKEAESDTMLGSRS